MQVEGFHHWSVLVSDVGRALEFYTGLLGLSQDMTRPDLGYPGAWLQVGACQIHLLQLPDPAAGAALPEHGGRDRHMALWVDEIDSLKQSLEQASVPYTLSRSGRAALFCRDPDGNALEFIVRQKVKG